jgi:putative ABC transport system substrate-binding protein
MKSKIAILALCAMLFALSPWAAAQQPKKVYRIGYVANDPALESARAEAIRRTLRDLGYIEGQNVAFEFRYHEGKRDRRALAAELVRLNVDLIVIAGGDLEIRAAMAATKTIPLIMTGRGSDPVKAGFIESLARPGGNITGVTTLNRELGGKRLELFKEAVPKLGRVAALYDSTLPGTTREINEAFPLVARTLSLTIKPWPIPAADNIEGALSALNKDRPDGLYVTLAGLFMRANNKRITDFALKNHFPSVYDNLRGIDDGGLIYYGADVPDSYRRIAYYIDRILKGAKPGDLPVEQPTKFEFVINSKTAKAIGLTIPPDVLARATKIIR